MNNSNNLSNIVVIIPALNEEDAIGKVLSDIPKDIINTIVVVDNGSTDRTATVAQRLGTKVIRESNKGYGNACLAGIKYISTELKNKPDIVVFIDADYSDYPEEIKKLILPILQDEYDLVIGSRTIGQNVKSQLPMSIYFANIIIAKILTRLLHVKLTDLGPFRAIRYSSLLDLKMKEHHLGWTTEFTIKAVKYRLRIKEIPVKYRQRIGIPKISGKLSSSVYAMIVIFYCICKYTIIPIKNNKN